jgi:hypothetical protein
MTCFGIVPILHLVCDILPNYFYIHILAAQLNIGAKYILSRAAAIKVSILFPKNVGTYFCYRFFRVNDDFFHV